MCLTMMVGTRLGSRVSGQNQARPVHDSRCYTRLYNLLGNVPQSSPICLVVALIYREVKSIGPIDLNVYEARAVDRMSSASEARPHGVRGPPTIGREAWPERRYLPAHARTGGEAA